MGLVKKLVYNVIANSKGKKNPDNLEVGARRK